jgi:hypothetical protein
MTLSEQPETQKSETKRFIMAQAQPISINRHPYADGGHKKMLIDR